MPKHGSAKPPKPRPESSPAALPFLADGKAVDPTLASLFASSAGPVQPLPKTRYRSPKPDTADAAAEEGISTPDEDTDADNDASQSEDNEELLVDDAESDASLEEEGEDEVGSLLGDRMDAVLLREAVADNAKLSGHRKRKRRDTEEELEDAYMRRLAEQEAKEEAQRLARRSKKRQKTIDGEVAGQPSNDQIDAGSEGVADEQGDTDMDEDADSGIPQHESLAPSKDAQELEKSSRTAFLANVSTEAMTSKSAKKTLLKHLSSFIPSLPAHIPPHKVESLRFRSTAYSNNIPRKAAFVKKELMDATTRSTNAYVVYSTQTAAREAAKRLNGTVVLDRHLRVDEVAHPAKTDHRRCVFVGNLGFVDDESIIRAAEGQEGNKKSKQKPPGDVEEGLWRQFGKAGTVESVRVVRDPKTRVGKGFAYVQFTDENAVEAALLFNDKKFPPLLPRKLRVVRAKSIKRNATETNPATSTHPSANGVYKPKVDLQQRSLQGRASKLLGRAAAAQVRRGTKPVISGANNLGGSIRAPESFVFEGHRASSKQGTSGLKLGKSGKKKAGKPRTRSSKRGAAWKAAGRKDASSK